VVGARFTKSTSPQKATGPRAENETLEEKMETLSPSGRPPGHTHPRTRGALYSSTHASALSLRLILVGAGRTVTAGSIRLTE